jgi:hypothetical protein
LTAEPERVRDGGTYWVPRGAGWAAVVVVQTDQAHALTAQSLPTSPKAWLAPVRGLVTLKDRLEDLVWRDPAADGKDRPAVTPAEFRAARVVERSPQPVAGGDPAPGSPEDRLRRVGRVLDLLPHQFTEEDW